MKRSCCVVYHCPHCHFPITIIGDPAPVDELLARYLAKNPLCHQCLKAIS